LRWCSSGQRIFHGAIVLYPAYNAAALDLQFGRITRAR
jgi:hypothetical protein